jgi:hypothetical protein
MKANQKNELASACQILATVCKKQEVQSETIERLIEQFGNAVGNFGVAIDILNRTGDLLNRTVEKLSEAYSSMEDTELPVVPRRRLHS